MNNYDGFDDWKDVQSRFKTQEPEPEEVLLASYSCGGWDGNARVIYRNGDKYFMTTGGHCSCYGLEGQFDSTEYNSKEVLLECIKKENWYSDNHTKEELIKLLSGKSEN